MKAMSHEHVMTFTDSYSDKNTLILVMDKMVDDLRNVLLAGQCPFDEEFARKVFRMMAEGVRHCHEKGIIHRDVKLENYLIDVNCEDEKVVVKLTDFGLSEHLKKDAVLHDVAGTFVTMSPEMLSGAGYNSKADCWSLGVCLYELLLNELPFYDNNLRMMKAKIQRGAIDFERIKEMETISVEALDLLQKILVVDPKKRLSVTEILRHPWLRDPSSR